MHKVSEAEWIEAKKQFNADPELKFLPYSHVQKRFGRTARRERFASAHPGYHTTHSFIKINDTLYALAQGQGSDAVIGAGAFGKVKYGCDEEGNYCLFKITKKTNASYPQVNQDEDDDQSIDDHDEPAIVGGSLVSEEFEAATLYDTRYSHGHTFRVNKDDFRKYYIHMQNLGTELLRHLNKNLSEDERFCLAIGACIEVHDLHNGDKSRENTSYCHLDIKPENFTVDTKGTVHLIDFGIAKKTPDDLLPDDRAGTIAMMARETQTGRQADMLALRRTLYHPPQLYALDKTYTISKHKAQYRSILSHTMIAAHDLQSELDTSSRDLVLEQLDGSNALTLAAILINERSGRPLTRQELKHDPALCESIVRLHRNGVSPAMIPFVVNNRFAQENPSTNDVRTNQLFTQFFSVLDRLNLESGIKFQKNHPAAYQAVQRIIASCRAVFPDQTDYHPLTEDQLSSFKSSFKAVIDAERPILEKHRGMKGVLDTILTVVASLGLFYPVTWLYQKKKHINNTFFNTATGNRLDEVEETLRNLPVPPSA